MKAGRVLRCYQDKKQMSWSAIQGIKIDSPLMATEGAQDLCDTRHLAVGNSNAVTDCGRAKALALCQHCRNRGKVKCVILSGGRSRQLPQNLWVGSSTHVRHHHIRAQELGDFHISVWVESGSGVICSFLISSPVEV